LNEAFSANAGGGLCFSPARLYRKENIGGAERSISRRMPVPPVVPAARLLRKKTGGLMVATTIRPQRFKSDTALYCSQPGACCFNFPKTESPAYLLPGKASFMGSVRANKPEAT
jgi:hypothetical protein